MWQNKCLGFILFGTVLCLLSISPVNSQQVTPDDVIRIIEQQWQENKDRYVGDYLDDIDLGAEFERVTGVGFDTVIAVFVVLIIVPNLVIMGLIFFFCWCCKCGVFHGRGRDRYPNSAPSHQMSPSYVHPAKPLGPAVPPKPHYPSGNTPISDTQANPQPSSGMWPWGKRDDDAWNRNQSGVHNQAYKEDW